MQNSVLPDPQVKQRSTVFLMYHELGTPSRSLSHTAPGYLRYVVNGSDFRSQMQWLRAEGWHATDTTTALADHLQPSVAITFDDGSETDLLVAVPVLKELGFTATFYITTGFLGKPGYLSATQVRAVSDAGFEIGCHSKTHPYLSDQNDLVLENEINAPKKELEDITGRRVEHFSCPGGRYDQRVRTIAQRSGYRTVATSSPYPNTDSTDPFALGRVAVMRNTSLASFQRICRGQGLWRIRFAAAVTAAAKVVLGNTAYDGIRARFLRHDNSCEQ